MTSSTPEIPLTFSTRLACLLAVDGMESFNDLCPLRLLLLPPYPAFLRKPVRGTNRRDTASVRSELMVIPSLREHEMRLKRYRRQ